jgi:hypothetical protein
MGREIKRVPLDFDWPLHERWSGFLMPESLFGKNCPDCDGHGWSPRGQELHDLWYGNGAVPFHPWDNGSTPLTLDTPAVREFAQRNVSRSPEFYGSGENAIAREAWRLAGLWNGQWSYHLNQDDVDALVTDGRLHDLTHTFNPETRWQPIDPPVRPTPEQVNEWAIRTMGHDSINAHVCITARCEREGVPHTCATCEGHGNVEAYPGQRAEADAWTSIEPPTGEGWQLWETVSEGSPVSPVFATAEALAQWLTTAEGGYASGPSHRPLSIEAARRFVGAGWAPSMIGDANGIHDGVAWVGNKEQES